MSAQQLTDQQWNYLKGLSKVHPSFEIATQRKHRNLDGIFVSVLDDSLSRIRLISSRHRFAPLSISATLSANSTSHSKNLVIPLIVEQGLAPFPLLADDPPAARATTNGRNLDQPFAGFNLGGILPEHQDVRG